MGGRDLVFHSPSPCPSLTSEAARMELFVSHEIPVTVLCISHTLGVPPGQGLNSRFPERQRTSLGSHKG